MTPAPDRQHYKITFAVLAVAGTAYSLLQSVVGPSLRDMQLELHASTTGIAWIFTGFLLSASVAIPIFGRLGDMFGKKRMLVAALGLLFAGLVVSALAASIEMMIAGRIIQGLGGAVFPLSFGIVRDEFPRERVPIGIALISALLGVGGALGIVISGPIVDHLSFHWIFWIPAAVVLVAAVCAFLFIPESPVREKGRVDVGGAFLLAGWLVALLVGISEGESWGWLSGRVLGLFGIAIVVCVAWVLFERRVTEPLVDMRMMRLRGVWTTNLCAVLFGFGMFGSFLLLPQLVQMPESTGYGFGASATEAGFFLVPTTIAMLLISPLSGRLSSSVGSRVPLLIGSTLSTVSFVLLAVAHSSPWQVYLASTLTGAGTGFAWASMANLIVEAVPPGQTGVATGMNTIMRTVGGAMSGQLLAAVLAASIAADGLPSDRGFTLAFGVSAVALGVTVLGALAVPRRVRRASVVTRPAASTSSGS